MTIDAAKFAELVRRALAEIPDSFKPYLAEVVVDIEDLPDRQTLVEVEIDDPYELLGLYHGTPLTERGPEAEPWLPDRIVLYRRSILRMCQTEQDVINEVRTTVLHEVGHHFGLDEDDLDELGYG